MRPLIRNLRRNTDPLFRQAGMEGEGAPGAAFMGAAGQSLPARLRRACLYGDGQTYSFMVTGAVLPGAKAGFTEA